MICECLFVLIIVLLVIAGVFYILGAEKLGDLTVDVIRFIIISLLLTVLVVLVLWLLYSMGYIDLGGITSPFYLG